MGFLKGTATFTTYRVMGDMPPDFKNFFDRQIKLFSFNETATGPEEKSIGWTSIENVLDTDFQYANYQYAAYALFSLRIDRKILPPALLRIRTMEAEKRYLEENKLKKIYREQRSDIKEALRLELLKTTPPVPSFHEVCWSLSEGWLIFGSLAEKASDDFEDLFKRTFNLELIPFVPWDPVFLDAEIVRSLAALKKDTGRP